MKILVLLFCAFFTSSISAKTVVISDIDDTIKMTGILNSKISVGFNGIFGKTAFAGMSELINEYYLNGADVYYVSGSPQMIDCIIDTFLTDLNFPQADQRFLKDKISSDSYKFKMDAIRHILAKDPTFIAVLIGDDTEHDAEVYHDISIEFPGRVKAIYIRAIQNAKLPKNPLIKNFFSSVEIAANEMLIGQFSYAGLETVVDGFINQTYGSGIQLKNYYCPREGRVEIKDLISKHQATGRPVVDLLLRTQLKIIQECMRR